MMRSPTGSSIGSPVGGCESDISFGRIVIPLETELNAYGFVILHGSVLLRFTETEHNSRQ
jgi:hypothetical protein